MNLLKENNIFFSIFKMSDAKSSFYDLYKEYVKYVMSKFCIIISDCELMFYKTGTFDKINFLSQTQFFKDKLSHNIYGKNGKIFYDDLCEIYEEGNENQSLKRLFVKALENKKIIYRPLCEEPHDISSIKKLLTLKMLCLDVLLKNTNVESFLCKKYVLACKVEEIEHVGCLYDTSFMPILIKKSSSYSDISEKFKRDGYKLEEIS